MSLREWYASPELAGLPGLPGTERRVRDAAERERWVSRRRNQRGGGLDYHIASLPPVTQAHLRREVALAAASAAGPGAGRDRQGDARRARKEANLARFAQLPVQRRERARARARLLDLLAEYRRAHGGTREQTRADFTAAVNLGEIELGQRVLAHLPRYEGRRALTEATLRRWEDAHARDGLMGLVDSYGNRRGSGKVETCAQLQQIVLGSIIAQPHITARKLLDYLEAARPDLADVSESAIRRFVRRWRSENLQLWTYMTNPDQWKSRFMPAFGSHHESISALNQLWEMDSTPGDWMLTDGRHVVMGVIDMWSRRLRLLVTPTSKAEAVCALFRRAVLDWGVPQAIKTDNGSDYVSSRFAGVLRDLEIEHVLCLPFASEQKGTIERGLGTMSHGILDLLPGFVGHNVAERKVIEARKSFAQRIMTAGETVEVELSAAELQERLDQWSEYVYGRDVHSSIGCSPFERVASWAGEVRRINDERALDMLLMEVAGTATVTKKGIRYQHHQYIHPALGPLVSDQVTLRRDPAIEGWLYVYALDGSFVCRAECPELADVTRTEVAAAARVQTRRLLAEQSQELRRLKRAQRENKADLVLRHRIEQAGNVTALQPRATTHSTPALAAAAEAARPPGAKPAADPGAGRRVDMAAFRASFTQPRADVREITDDPRAQYERWVRLDRRVQRGETLAVAEQRFHHYFPTTPAYSSMKGFYEAFGLDVQA